MKMYELLNVSDQLNSLPLGKLTIAQRAALTRTICAISQARKPFDEALKEAREKLKPEGFDDLPARDRAPLTRRHSISCSSMSITRLCVPPSSPISTQR